MQLDAQLVAAAISSREAFAKVHPHIIETDFTPAGAFWWRLVCEWYERDRTSTTVDKDALTQFAEKRIPNPKLRDTLLGFGRDLPADVSPANAVALCLELKRYNCGMELATAIAAGDQKKQAKLIPLFAELAAATALKKQQRDVKYEDACSIDELFEKVGQANRVPIYPARLNERIGGGCLPGHHIILFGRPEIGKSTFSINFAAGLAVKGRQRVLYVGNEDQINILKARAVSRITGMTEAEIAADRPKAIALYRERGGEDRLRLLQVFNGSADDLRQPIEEFAPTVLVLDQIRNLATGSDGKVAQLEDAGQAIRRLLLEYKLIGLSITQAGASAAGKTWLSMEDLDSSKTGLPGTADLMLGYGADAILESRNQRGLNPVKNKLSSLPNAHEGLIVDVNKSLAVVR